MFIQPADSRFPNLRTLVPPGQILDKPLRSSELSHCCGSHLRSIIRFGDLSNQALIQNTPHCHLANRRVCVLLSDGFDQRKFAHSFDSERPNVRRLILKGDLVHVVETGDSNDCAGTNTSISIGESNPIQNITIRQTQDGGCTHFRTRILHDCVGQLALLRQSLHGFLSNQGRLIFLCDLRQDVKTRELAHRRSANLGTWIPCCSCVNQRLLIYGFDDSPPDAGVRISE